MSSRNTHTILDLNNSSFMCSISILPINNNTTYNDEFNNAYVTSKGDLIMQIQTQFFIYNLSSHNWSVKTDFPYFVPWTSGKYLDNIWIITSNNSRLISCIINGDNELKNGPNIATEKSCMVSMNETHIVMTGGIWKSYSNKTWLWSYPGKWKRLQDIKEDRQSHSCGLFNHKDVVIIGGYDERESRYINSYEIYKNNKWIKIDHTLQVLSNSMVEFNGDLYVIEHERQNLY